MDFGAYSPADVAAIVAWPGSEAEARAWCGEPAPNVEALARWHRDPDVRPFVLRDDDGPVAYGELWTDEDEVELARLIVRPSARGRGIGRRLVEELVRRAPPLPAFVRVVPDNAAAVRCYEVAGFSRVSAEQEETFNRSQPRPYVWMRRDAP